MWELKDEKVISNKIWNIISIVHGTPKCGVCKLYLSENFGFWNILATNIYIIKKKSL